MQKKLPKFTLYSSREQFISLTATLEALKHDGVKNNYVKLCWHRHRLLPWSGALR